MTRTPKGGRADDGLLALKLFDRLFPAASWGAWRAWLCAVLGLPMSATEAAIYHTLTGRAELPAGRCREVWTVAGRRSGKSRMAAFMAVYLAALRVYKLAPGERAVVLVISPGRSQSRVIFQYATAMLESVPALEQLITRQTADSIDLSTGVSIQIGSASYRTPRGFTVCGLVADEIAFWRDDSGGAANPDVEIMRALRPALASVPGSLLIPIGTPYAQRGESFRNYAKHYGKASDVLVWQAPTVAMNPTISQHVVDAALADDPASAAAEWLGQFRSDLETLYSREALAGVVIPGRTELPALPGIHYVSFVDPSGGSADAFTLAIAHRDRAGLPILDLVREVRPPFSPEGVTADFAKELKRYNVATVTGDKYAGEWPREQFRKHGIEYQTAELTRSELYLELLPLVNSGTVEILDLQILKAQLSGLERRTGRTGKDAIDHRAGSHDDVANAAAGALVMATRSTDYATLPASFKWCNRAASIRTFRMSTCYLFGGAFKPTMDACCKNCEGHKFVLAAKQAHADRTNEILPYVQFYRQRLQGNDFTALVRANQWAESVGL